MKITSDVIVIGDGPAGSSTAIEIAKAGYKVCLLEKDEFPGQTNICAGGMPKSILKEIGLSTDIIEKTILGSKHYFPWGLEESFFDGKNLQVTVYRQVLDKSIANLAEECGAKLLTSTLAKDVSKKNEKICVITENQSTKNKSMIESKIVVFADGPNTLAYRKFKIGFKPDKDKTVVSVICEVEWKNNPLEHYELYFDPKISPWGYGWIFPKRHTVNVGLGILYSKLEKNIIKYFNYLLTEYPIASKKLKGKRVQIFESALIPFAPSDKIFEESMLVVGDAAGMTNPIFGGGIASAIHGGRIAGNLCVRALEKEDFSREFLSHYQIDWEKTKYHKINKLFYTTSNIFLYLSKIDKNAYSKLVSITNRGIRDVIGNLKRLLYY